MTGIFSSPSRKAAALISLAVLASSTPAQANAPFCNPAHHFKRALMVGLAKRYVNVINLRNPALFPLVFSQDLVLDSTAGQTEGLAQYSALMAGVYAGLPDIHYEIDEILVDGDNFVLRYSYSGTHLGELFGFPPTGEVVSCTGLEINRVANGRIYESVNFTDVNCLLTALSGQ